MIFTYLHSHTLLLPLRNNNNFIPNSVFFHILFYFALFTIIVRIFLSFSLFFDVTLLSSEFLLSAFVPIMRYSNPDIEKSNKNGFAKILVFIRNYSTNSKLSKTFKGSGNKTVVLVCDNSSNKFDLFPNIKAAADFSGFSKHIFINYLLDRDNIDNNSETKFLNLNDLKDINNIKKRILEHQYSYYTVDYFIKINSIDKLMSVLNTNNLYEDYLTFTKVRELSSDLKGILLGLVLGDTYIQQITPNVNSRLMFKQGAVHKEYILHLYELFKSFTETPIKETTRFDKRVNKTYHGLEFTTLWYPCFNEFRTLFYNNEGNKTIPANIGELLTPLSLAYWAMDDGTKQSSGFTFCTDSFNLPEVQLLISSLKEKFDLNCNLVNYSKGCYRIYIKADSMDKFRNLVQPYFHPSMEYKLR
jgi:hypothetical protein